MAFHWSLSDSKSPQVSSPPLSILAVLNNAVVWMVSTRLPISKSSSLFSNPLVTMPNAPIIIAIIVSCMFHSFFNSLARSRYFSFFSHSFSFIPWSAGTATSTILQILFLLLLLLLLIIIRSGLLAEIELSVCMSKSQGYFLWQVLDCAYTICSYGQTEISCTSPRITLPNESCLVLYSFCTNLLHSLIMWFMVSSLSSHRLHFLFCCVLSILVLIWWFLKRCFVLLLGEVLFLS